MLVPTSAFATDFYVAAGGAGTACTDPQNPCDTFAEMVTAVVNDNATPHTVHIRATQVFNENLTINNGSFFANFDGATIDGGWGGAAGERAFVTTSTPAQPTMTIARPNMTVRNIEARQLALNQFAVILEGQGDVLRDVSALTMDTASVVGTIKTQFSGDQLLDRVYSEANSKASALRVDSGAVTVRDSTLVRGNPGAETGPLVDLQAEAHFDRVRVEANFLGNQPAVAVKVGAAGGVRPITLDDTLVTGGTHSLEVSDLGGASNSPAVSIRQSVLDARGQGQDDSGANNRSIRLNLVNAASSPQVGVSNSILVDHPGSVDATGTAPSVACSTTELPAAAPPVGSTTYIDCPAGASGNHGFASPLDLFVGPGGAVMTEAFDFHLKPGSAAIDSGSATPLEAGESTTDLDGNPRLRSGSFRCDSAPRDRGVFEVQAPGVPPTAAIAGATSGVVGAPLAFQGSASGGSSPPASYAWNFGDGATATGGNTSHAFSAPGARIVTLTVGDGKGCTGVATRTLVIAGPGGAGSAPKLSGVRLSRKRFRAKQGTTLSFTLDRAASVRATVTKSVRGRRVGRRCSTRAKRGRRCKAVVTVLRKTVVGRRGANKAKLATRKLKPGRYTLNVAASAGGKRSKTVKVAFVVRRR
jgi:hypothetical protein